MIVSSLFCLFTFLFSILEFLHLFVHIFIFSLNSGINMSRLRHPNMVSLAGYCAEHGQRLLVYEYVGNESLHDMLHFSEDGSKILTWNACVRVALGTAQALEYVTCV
ncbi:Tyrosine-protein kinase [Trema orientale]|uniref:Tyrosine-protein kinase n=1 Tax=Trema orientale TaxID=63057 RepID=A0A2P5FK85_TREOI|nr:Tyrosine-protein kinase [Trema orientale]